MSLELNHLRAKREAIAQLPDPATRRTIRTSAAVTQDDLARALGVTRETVSRWESGTRDPKGEHLLDYVELLEELRHG